MATVQERGRGRPPAVPPRGKSGEFARNLRRYRMEVAMSVEVMAQKACVSRSLVNKFEAGKAHPSVDTLSRLAKVLKVSIADLYED